MAARANNITLEEYMEKYLWSPLGMTDMTFHPLKKNSVKEKLVDMSVRDSGITMFGTTDDPEAKVKYTDDTVWSQETQHCHGGAGAYGNFVQYQSLLHSICADDGKLLQSSTIDEMFKKQLTPAAEAALSATRNIPAVNNIFGGDPPELKFNYALGGLVNETSFPGRREGTLSWGGLPNLLWFIDRKSGISGGMFQMNLCSPKIALLISHAGIGAQVAPPGDPKIVALYREWKLVLYKEAGIEL